MNLYGTPDGRIEALRAEVIGLLAMLDMQQDALNAKMLKHNAAKGMDKEPLEENDPNRVPEIPFQIFATVTDEGVPVLCCRHGGFFWQGEDGEMRFTGTDGSSAFEDFDLYSGLTAFSEDDEVWAYLDTITDPGVPTAGLVAGTDTIPGGAYAVMVGKMSGVPLEQHVTGHICAVNRSLNLGHSFKPTKLTDTTASVSSGRVEMRDGSTIVVTPADIDYTSNDKFWLVIDYTSATVAAGPNLVGGTTWPAYFDTTANKVNVPILEFVDNAWEGLVRHQTNDIIDRHGILDSDVPSTGYKSLERSAADAPDKHAQQIRNFRTADSHKVPHAYDTGGVKDIEWRYPVQGPGDAPGSISDGTVVTAVSNGAESAYASANINILTRSHNVANGDEVWGAESESPTAVSAGVTWTGGTLYQVWQVKSGGYGWDWVRAHG